VDRRLVRCGGCTATVARAFAMHASAANAAPSFSGSLGFSVYVHECVCVPLNAPRLDFI
jgi:hypothetical protein